MVHLGLANTRLKDFYDIWVLVRAQKFKDDRLARAIRATFDRRKTQIPTERPDALSETFANDPTKIQQWTAFIQDVAIDPGPLNDVVEMLAAFLMPYGERGAQHERLGTATVGKPR